MEIQTLPGTVIELSPSEYSVKSVLSSLFLTGGLVLSQVSGMTGLPPYVLQNWVKRGFVPPPVGKKYSKCQFCRIAIINFLKDDLKIDNIVKLIDYTKVRSNDLTADSMDDCELYSCFVEAAVHAEPDPGKINEAVIDSLREYKEPYPGAGKKVSDVLKVMVILYISSHIKKSAKFLLSSFNL